MTRYRTHPVGRPHDGGCHLHEARISYMHLNSRRIIVYRWIWMHPAVTYCCHYRSTALNTLRPLLWQFNTFVHYGDYTSPQAGQMMLSQFPTALYGGSWKSHHINQFAMTTCPFHLNWYVSHSNRHPFHSDRCLFHCQPYVACVHTKEKCNLFQTGRDPSVHL